MTILSSEEELFDEWRCNRPGFVADGVIDESAYLRSTRKLLFVLKEVNDPDGGEWDLRQYVREGCRSQTWNNITRWVEGIRKLQEDLSWADLAEITKDRRRQILQSIAAINIKKSPGSHTSDLALLKKTSEEDKLFLNRQVALYDADVIICCGTSDLLHCLVSLTEVPKWISTRRGVWFYEYKNNKYVVAYSHPEARCASNLLYYGLIDAMKEILESQPNNTLDTDAP